MSPSQGSLHWRVSAKSLYWASVGRRHLPAGKTPAEVASKLASKVKIKTRVKIVPSYVNRLFFLAFFGFSCYFDPSLAGRPSVPLDRGLFFQARSIFITVFLWLSTLCSFLNIDLVGTESLTAV